MSKRKRQDRGGPIFNLIFGILVVSAILGIFLMFEFFGSGILFWISVLWTFFFGISAWCWLDETRYDKFETIMQPVINALMLLLVAAIAIGGLIRFVSDIMAGNKVIMNIIVLIIVELSAGMFIVIFGRPLIEEIRDILRGNNNK